MILFDPWVSKTEFSFKQLVPESPIEFDLSKLTHRCYNFYTTKIGKWAYRKISNCIDYKKATDIHLPIKNVNIECYYLDDTDKIKLFPKLSTSTVTVIPSLGNDTVFFKSITNLLDYIDFNYLINTDLLWVFKKDEDKKLIFLKKPVKIELDQSSFSITLKQEWAKASYWENTLCTERVTAENISNRVQSLQLQALSELGNNITSENLLPDKQTLQKAYTEFKPDEWGNYSEKYLKNYIQNTNNFCDTYSMLAETLKTFYFSWSLQIVGSLLNYNSISNFVLNSINNIISTKGLSSTFFTYWDNQIKEKYTITPQEKSMYGITQRALKQAGKEILKHLDIINNPAKILNMQVFCSFAQTNQVGPWLLAMADNFNRLRPPSVSAEEYKKPTIEIKKWDDIRNSEVEFLRGKNKKTLWSDFFKENQIQDKDISDLVTNFLEKDEMPKVGIVASGGGYRAMFAFASFCKKFEELNYWNLADYVSTLSGSTWFLFPYLYCLKSKPDINIKEYNSGELGNNFSTFEREFEQQTHGSRAIEYLFSKTKGTTRSVDFYSMFLGRALLSKYDNDVLGLSAKLSELNEISKNKFIPIATAIFQTDKYKKSESNQRNYTWCEFSPLAVGSKDLETYVETKNCGFSTQSKPSNELPLAYLMGIWGSAYTINADWIKNHGKITIPSWLSRVIADEKTVLGYINNIMQALEQAFLLKDQQEAAIIQKQTSRASAGIIPNFSSQDIQSDYCKNYLDLYDAGIDFNLPFPPLLDREINIYFVCDASANIDAEKNQLKKVADYAKNKNYPFPEINFEKSYKNGEIKIFFDRKNQEAPVIVYIPNEIKHDTFSFDYTNKQIKKIDKSMSTKIEGLKNSLNLALCLALVNKYAKTEKEQKIRETLMDQLESPTTTPHSPLPSELQNNLQALSTQLKALRQKLIKLNDGMTTLTGKLK